MDRLLAGEDGLRPRALPAAGGCGNGGQAVFRLDILRSLQLHRKLALGIAIAGAGAGGGLLVLVGRLPGREHRLYSARRRPGDAAGAKLALLRSAGPTTRNTYESYITAADTERDARGRAGGRGAQAGVRHLAAKRRERPGRGGPVEVGDQGNARREPAINSRSTRAPTMGRPPPMRPTP